MKIQNSIHQSIISGLFPLLILTGFTGMCQDTLQYEISNRRNSEESMKKPYVILISADGFRYDYAEKYQAENLLKLSKSGVKAEAMFPAYPSNTFPNHYAIITGMYPSSNGLVDNSFYDPARKQTYEMGNKNMVKDSSWYGGLPLWGLAEKNQMVSASLFWVSSESNVAGIPPTYYYKYHNKFSNERKVEIVKSWLQLPEEKRPHLITLYFPEVDSRGHYFGPDSPETEVAVLAVDKAIGLLVDEIEKLGLDNVNFIFVSDHGMIKADQTIPLPTVADTTNYKMINSYTSARITSLGGGKIKTLFKQLKNDGEGNYKAYLAKRFPRKLHFRKNAEDRIGDIILIPETGKIFANPKHKSTYVGAHGYNPYKVPEMKATFMAWGDDFKQGVEISAFRNIHVYPLVANILYLPINHKIDGKARVLKKVLLK